MNDEGMVSSLRSEDFSSAVWRACEVQECLAVLGKLRLGEGTQWFCTLGQGPAMA